MDYNFTVERTASGCGGGRRRKSYKGVEESLSFSRMANTNFSSYRDIYMCVYM